MVSVDIPRVIGIDVGSRSIELVLREAGQVAHQAKLPTTFDPLAQCHRLLDDLPPARIVATGYGRKLLVEHLKDQRVTAITEIQAYALGARHLFPGVRTVLDIGGQDSKAIALGVAGKVVKFEMNDRCAAGTGKFLEFMAAALQVPLEDFGGFALTANRRIQINSMCTVFAESEATSLMARGEAPANIALGLHLAIVQRTLAMLRRVGVVEPVLFAGGVAHNPCVCALLEEHLGIPVIIPDQPDLVGALGAALYGERGRRTAVPATAAASKLPNEERL
ncbi:MAG: acyl-CoA dehydratase activase [Deltaproteobacteria bacterium]|jgi:(R)-2-hydroxyacyl-CoA dehydratese activating ATPase